MCVCTRPVLYLVEAEGQITASSIPRYITTFIGISWLGGFLGVGERGRKLPGMRGVNTQYTQG